MSSGNRFWATAGGELARFSGLARLSARWRGGAGAILAFDRIQPPGDSRFRPLRSTGITPVILDRAVAALKRWKFDLVSMDEVCRRAREPRSDHRFVALTFDGRYRDVVTHAYPVLSRHDVPFAVYLPTAFPDGLGRAWWLAVQDIVARHDRISVVVKGRDRHFSAHTAVEKRELHDFLVKWLQSLATSDLSVAISDLCGRYSADPVQLSRESAMTWEDVARLAADPRVTIGSATVNYPVLSAIGDDEARREMAMGRAVAQAAIGRDLAHFAYPFGQRGTFETRHVRIAREIGFASAVTTVPGMVEADSRADLLALPRISWGGERTSLRRLRAMMSGRALPDRR